MGIDAGWDACLRPQFMRELAVVVRKNRIHPEPLASFIEGILF